MISFIRILGIASIAPVRPIVTPDDLGHHGRVERVTLEIFDYSTPIECPHIC